VFLESHQRQRCTSAPHGGPSHRIRTLPDRCGAEHVRLWEQANGARSHRDADVESVTAIRSSQRG
jgi:hypothetical protein